MIAAIVFGFFGLVATLVGMQCSKIGGENYVLKGRIAAIGGVFYLLQGKVEIAQEKVICFQQASLQTCLVERKVIGSLVQKKFKRLLLEVRSLRDNTQGRSEDAHLIST